jgi:predicted nucleic acid-binding protein
VTPGFVADASIGVAWSVEAQASEDTERLRDSAISGTPVTIPLLWMLEVSNGLLMLVRRGRITKAVWSEAVRLNGQVHFNLDDEAPGRALTTVLDVAVQNGLTVYDATYLELALRRGLPLASRDSALNKAAKKCGVKTLL